MENIIDTLLTLADKTGPVGAVIIAIGIIILYYFKKTNTAVVDTNKETSKAVQSVDDNIQVLSNTVLDMNSTNKDLILSLSNNSNNLTTSIVTALTTAQNELNAQKKAKHDADYLQRLNNASSIKKRLFDILNITNSDLVVLTELHNGGYNLSGLPFTSYNITEQTNSTNAVPLTCMLENRPMSEYSFIYKEVINNRNNIFWGNINEIDVDIDLHISTKLQRIGKTSMICIGLFNRMNTLFAFINIFYNDKYLTQDFIDNLNISKQISFIINKIDNYNDD